MTVRKKEIKKKKKRKGNTVGRQAWIKSFAGEFLFFELFIEKPQIQISY